MVSTEHFGKHVADRTPLIYWLLGAGAKITKNMDKDRDLFPYFPWNSEECVKPAHFASRQKRFLETLVSFLDTD